MVPPYLQITHCVHSALECFKMTTYIFTHFCLVSFLLPLYSFSLLISVTFISIQARSYSRNGNGHIHQNISPISPQILVFNRGMSMWIYQLLKLHLVFKISLFSDGSLCWFWARPLSGLAKLGPSKLLPGIKNSLRDSNCKFIFYIYITYMFSWTYQ